VCRKYYDTVTRTYKPTDEECAVVHAREDEWRREYFATHEFRDGKVFLKKTPLWQRIKSAIGLQ
jgi:hypothetical protein